MSKLIKTESYTTLVHDIGELYNHAHHALVESYWQIGRRIVEQEQRGQANVVYIKQLIEQLSEDLSRQWDSGFSKRNLYKMRQFYLAHKLVPAPAQLSWSQHVELLPVTNNGARYVFPRVVLESVKLIHYYKTPTL